jgi:hypothetical protein
MVGVIPQSNMAELKNILKEEEGDKYQALLELNIRIAEKLDPSIVDLDTILSPTEICVLLICSIDVQVCNGGYDQYFYYSGSHVLETINAIKQVGLDDLLANYIEAINVFPDGIVPKEDSVRQSIMDQFTDDQRDKLNQLSDRYYEINDPEALFDFAFKHQNEIMV